MSVSTITNLENDLIDACHSNNITKVKSLIETTSFNKGYEEALHCALLTCIDFDSYECCEFILNQNLEEESLVIALHEVDGKMHDLVAEALDKCVTVV